MEEWKPIREIIIIGENIRLVKTYNEYEVSNKGRIRNSKTLYVLKSYKKGGYRKIDLKLDGRKRKWYIHRLVMMTFDDNLENKSQVNHINGIKHDNQTGNLEWCTAKENSIHAWSTGLATVHAYPNYNRRVCILCTTTGKVYKSIGEAEHEYNIQGIQACCDHKMPYCGRLNGQRLVWEYVDEERMCKAKEKDSPRVLCVTTDEIFNNTRDASNYYDISCSSLTACCNGKNSYAGIVDGNKMIWKYLEDD